MTSSHHTYFGLHELNRACLGFGADMEHNLTEFQQQQAHKEFNQHPSISQPPFYNITYCQRPETTLHPHEDQVVPSSQRPMLGSLRKEAKPLPPLPDPGELMSDEAADSEVEFFINDRQNLLPKSCPKAMCKNTNRHSGQVNHAYQESLMHGIGAGMSPIASSWPFSEGASSGKGSGFGSNIWSFAPQREDSLEKKQSSRLCFSHPGSCSGLLHGAYPNEKPTVPPRIPILPKPPAPAKTLRPYEEDKPPKIPPRVPLVPPCPPRTPSPKSLPIYINGVMPATQSFAANPKYVSKALQRQQSERPPSAAQSSPCIVPILKDGRQASATHYILLPPGQRAHSDQQDRILNEPSRTGSSTWQIK